MTQTVEKTETKQHTPGPWGTNGSHIYAPDGAIIAVVHNPGSKASDYPLVANRDLMAAAPELFELVKLFERTIEYEIKKSNRSGDDEGARMKMVTLAIVRDVIAKASA